MKNLKAKEERKSNGGQNTNGDDKCLRVETGSGGDAVKEQNGVDDRQQPWVVGGFALQFGGEKSEKVWKSMEKDEQRLQKKKIEEEDQECSRKEEWPN